MTYAGLWKPIHDIINYSISICPFESGNCRKKVEKLQKLEDLKNRTGFFDGKRAFSMQ